MTRDQHSKLQVGMVVQLRPDLDLNPMFGGCFLTITEIKSFGVQGYVQSLGENGKMGGQAYLRPKYEDFEFVGYTVWEIDHAGRGKAIDSPFHEV